jgi:hypothetical protein
MARMLETTIATIQDEFKIKLINQADTLLATSLVLSVLDKLGLENRLSVAVDVTNKQHTFKLTLTFLKCIPMIEVIKILDNPNIASVIVVNNGEAGNKMLQLIVNVFTSESEQTMTARPTITINDVPLNEGTVRRGLTLHETTKENMLQVMKAITASAQGGDEITWWAAVEGDKVIFDAVPVRRFDAFMFLFLKNTIKDILTITFYQENVISDQKEDHIEIVMKSEPLTTPDATVYNNHTGNTDKISKLRQALLSSVTESVVCGKKASLKSRRKSQNLWSKIVSFVSASDVEDDDDDIDDMDDK